jgi:hypothetical protein
MPGTHGGTRYTINSRGVRGPELPLPEATYRILCVGNQTTECLFLDDDEAWPSRLMSYLNVQDPDHPVWVGDVGIPNYATFHHLRFLEKSDLAGEVDCVLVLMGVNDFLWYVSDGPEFDPLRAEESRQPLWVRSRLLSLARGRFRSATARYSPVVHDAEAENLERLRRLRRESPLSEQLPDLDVALDAFRDRVRRIVATCRARGLRVVCLTEPVLWDAGLSSQARDLIFGGWINWRRDAGYLSLNKLREGIDAYDSALRDTCRNLDAECIDLTRMNGHAEWFYDDCHYTVAGAGELARRVGEWFGQHPPRRSARPGLPPTLIR